MGKHIAVVLAALAAVGCGRGGSSSEDGGALPPAEVWSQLDIVTYLLPSGHVNHPYSVALESTGGVPPYTYFLWDRVLPDGLTLSPTGVISGTPMLAGTWNFTIGVRDAMNDVNGRLLAIQMGSDFTAQGAGWHAVAAGTTETLHGVDFTDASNGWIVGTARTIRRTTNGGLNFWDRYGNPAYPRWGATVSPTDPSTQISTSSPPVGLYQFTRVHALSADTAWITTMGANEDLYSANALERTAHVLRTTTGGDAWDRIVTTTNQPAWGLHAFTATDARVATKASEADPTSHVMGIVGSSDAWNAPFGQAGLNDVAFTSSSAGVAVGTTVWRTTNGGALWSVIAAPSGTYRAVAYVNPSTIVAVGDAGKIIRSIDGGLTWGAVSGPTAQDLWDVSFAGSTGWAVGLNGAILKTTNSGASWTVEFSGTTANLFGVCAVSSTAAWAVGQGGTCLKRQ
jgi:photosystem II stability/assembly factor-like uncharacterized protein